MNAPTPPIVGIHARKGKKKLRDADVIRALQANHGLITQSCVALGCSRTALHKYLLKRPYLNEYREEQVEIVLDVAEHNVVNGIYAGDAQYTRWFLDRQGQRRGYVTRAEHSGPGGTPIPFTIIERVPPLIDRLGAEDVDADS